MNATPKTGRGWRYTLIGLCIVAVIALGAFLWIVVLSPRPLDFAGGRSIPLSEYHDGDPTGVPAELKTASLVERGEYLARAADCEACHTSQGGTPYAGGRAFVLPFGTLYSTNITPDGATGIGKYTDADFLNAVHKGIGLEGKKLYPAMPYPSYTAMTDADALAIKAYLFSLPPLDAPTPKNSLVFPFDQRALMGVWAALFNSDKRFEPRSGHDPQWNRGAYLVEAMGHCGECHTPRNLGFALDQRKKFTGAVQAGWRAYNITPDRASGIGAWSDADLAHYLAMGHADGRGTATGPMAEAVNMSLSHLTSGDITAMVTYLRTVNSLSTSDLPEPKATPAPASHAEGVAANVDPTGKAVFAGACAGCHDWTGVSPGIPVATLTGSRSVNDPTATNVVQVIIAGAQLKGVDQRFNMPSFGAAYSDSEIASLANYVTTRFGAQPSSVTPEKIAELRRLN